MKTIGFVLMLLFCVGLFLGVAHDNTWLIVCGPWIGWVTRGASN
jgi:hypothetical protein